MACSAIILCLKKRTRVATTALSYAKVSHLRRFSPREPLIRKRAYLYSAQARTTIGAQLAALSPTSRPIAFSLRGELSCQVTPLLPGLEFCWCESAC